MVATVEARDAAGRMTPGRGLRIDAFGHAGASDSTSFAPSEKPGKDYEME
ncbi:hypothetical protein Bsp3421_000400 (plasmid) [Burkholderia sp. FERM BP-3421]|jgi:hypothetical protein|nr:hypothetical protein [Burkholderia sp. FERM BP-3421]WDD90474.1 hypothetical protein Bsp3421_000319 [Burkholderia sp. FERM BP-3421]WDD90542.1 hypothetical protein Bsp3421_000400 [Burkholderia sp. FERM BP-3421]